MPVKKEVDYLSHMILLRILIKKSHVIPINIKMMTINAKKNR